MATAIMTTFRFPAAARIRMRGDGEVIVETSAQEIGTGNYTVLTQVAADGLGVDPQRVSMGLGDTSLPEACPTTGSASTMCVGSAVMDAATKLRARLADLACAQGVAADDYIGAMRGAGVAEVVADGSWSPGAPKNLAGVMVPVNLDIPDLDVFFVEEDDPRASLLGARGIGELGAVGVAPAIANAVYHATGKRVRDLPIRIECVLGSS